MKTRCSCYGAIADAVTVSSLADLIFDYGHGGGQLPKSLSRLSDEDFYCGGSSRDHNSGALFYMWQPGDVPEKLWMYEGDDTMVHLSLHDDVIAIEQRLTPVSHTKKVSVAHMYDHGDELMAGLSDKMVAEGEPIRYQNVMMDGLLWATRSFVAEGRDIDPFFFIADTVAGLRKTDSSKLPMLYR